jgi:hypothetical protein
MGPASGGFTALLQGNASGPMPGQQQVQQQQQQYPVGQQMVSSQQHRNCVHTAMLVCCKAIRLVIKSWALYVGVAVLFGCCYQLLVHINCLP